MLCSIKTLEGCTIAASDGVIGHVRDFHFDDQDWVIRHLVVDCGNWLPGRKVLISPRAIGHLDWAQRELGVSITKDQIRNSPEVDTDQPVSRQHELQLNEHYGYPVYWGGIGYWGSGMYPNMVLPGYGGFGSPEAIRQEGENAGARTGAVEARGDAHLRSCRAVMKYHVHAGDGDIGRVDGMLVDDQTWAIRYLVVDTHKWWLGHRVLVSPTWIRTVSWADEAVSVHLSREAIKRAAPYDAAITLSRSQEADLYTHYDRPAYWRDRREHALREPV